MEGRRMAAPNVPDGTVEMNSKPRRRRRSWLLLMLVAQIALTAVMGFVFMERHWNQVTRRLSEATARDIGAIVDLYMAGAGKEEAARSADRAKLFELARNRFGLSVSAIEGGASLPPAQPKPFFDLLDRALSEEVRAHLRHPFWIDTVGHSRVIDIRVKTDNEILRFVAPRSQAYASNSHIFLVWMIGTSVLLVTATLVVLRHNAKE
jgi:two-component system, OmpR family, osmolarity sensor histidine kinase EnvZ